MVHTCRNAIYLINTMTKIFLLSLDHFTPTSTLRILSLDKSSKGYLTLFCFFLNSGSKMDSGLLLELNVHSSRHILPKVDYLVPVLEEFPQNNFRLSALLKDTIATFYQLRSNSWWWKNLGKRSTITITYQPGGQHKIFFLHYCVLLY